MLVVSQFASLEESPLAGAARNIPDKPFELDPDWEVDPESLEILEKIGAPRILSSFAYVNRCVFIDFGPWVSAVLTARPASRA